MLGRIASIVILICATVSVGHAGDRQKIGYGRLITNDLIGDGHDRWRTGALVSSHIRGYDWNGSLPEGFGNLIEYRWRAEIMAPSNLTTVKPGDRPYAGTVAVGAFTHWSKFGFDLSLGGEIVAIGPQTGLDWLQTQVHKMAGITPPSDAVLAAQVPNQILLNAEFEVGRDVALGDSAMLRPFVSGAVGPEDMVRAGFDVVIGQVGRSELLLRDPVSGHRYRAIRSAPQGYSFVLGADIAKVFDSIYLPASSGLTLTDNRPRARAGVFWQGEKSSVFYGLTWLGREFETQTESQVIGAIRLNLHF